MRRSKPHIQTKYRALVDITVNGIPYREGDVIINATPGNTEPMLRFGQCEAIDESQIAAASAAAPEKEQ